MWWPTEKLKIDFSVGPTVEDHPQVFSQKKVHPLDYIFDTCASTSSSNCFNDGEAEHMCLNPFARTQVSSVKKMFCKLGAR